MSTFKVETEINLEEASQKFGTVAGRVQGALAGKGLLSTATPPVYINQQGQQQQYNGWIPSDLTQLNDDALGGYLGLLSGWLDYVQQQSAEAHSAMTIADKKLEFVEAHLLMIHKRDETNKKRPEPERKAMVLIDRRYVEAQTESIYHETYYRHVKAIVTAAEQNYAAISRRISQRQTDIERQRRTSSTGNATPMGPMFKRT